MSNSSVPSREIDSFKHKSHFKMPHGDEGLDTPKEMLYDTCNCGVHITGGLGTSTRQHLQL